MPGVALAALRGDLSEPVEWRDVGLVSGLFIYPVKSMSGLAVEEFRAGEAGPEAGPLVDRRFCVVDQTGKFVTARR